MYNYFHQEDVDFAINVFNKNTISKSEKKAFDGNSAIPTIMFSKKIEEFRSKFSHFKIIRKDLLTFILYPLSGGFDHKCFITSGTLRFLNFIEKILQPFGRVFAFRILVVIET